MTSPAKLELCHIFPPLWTIEKTFDSWRMSIDLYKAWRQKIKKKYREASVLPSFARNALKWPPFPPSQQYGYCTRQWHYIMKEYERIWKWSIWHCHPCWDAIVSQGLRKMQIKFPGGTRKNEVGQYISLSPCLGLIGQQFEQTSSVQSGHRHICTVCHFIKGKNLANIKTPTQWLRQRGSMEGHRVPLALHLKHCEKRCNRNRARQEPWGHTLFISQLWLKMQLKQCSNRLQSGPLPASRQSSQHHPTVELCPQGQDDPMTDCL